MQKDCSDGKLAAEFRRFKAVTCKNCKLSQLYLLIRVEFGLTETPSSIGIFPLAQTA
jgi:hypothetical protein